MRTLGDMGKLDPIDPRSPYRQVADAIRAEILEGAYAPGDKLPAHANVADEYGVSIGTVKRAYAALQRERFIVTRQGQGAYVLPPEAREDEESEPTVREMLLDIQRRLEAIERKVGIE